MADTIIGTAGIFFTLLLIAVGSFVVGLIVCGITDFVRSLHGHHRHHHHGVHHGPFTVSPATVADHIHRAATESANVLSGIRDAPGSVPRVAEDAGQWRVALELTAGLLAILSSHLVSRLRHTYTDAYVRAVADLCAGNLFRSHPSPAGVPVHQLLAEARAALPPEANPPHDLFAPAPDLYRHLARRVAPDLPGSPDLQKLEDRIAERIGAAVTLDMAPYVR